MRQGAGEGRVDNSQQNYLSLGAELTHLNSSIVST